MFRILDDNEFNCSETVRPGCKLYFIFCGLLCPDIVV